MTREKKSKKNNPWPILWMESALREHKMKRWREIKDSGAVSLHIWACALLTVALLVQLLSRSQSLSLSISLPIPPSFFYIRNACSHTVFSCSTVHISTLDQMLFPVIVPFYKCSHVLVSIQTILLTLSHGVWRPTNETGNQC